MTKLSWNTHCLLTRMALHSADPVCLEEKVPVIRLEEFIDRARRPLPNLIRWYQDLLETKTGIKSRTESPVSAIVTVRDLLAALKINREVMPGYVRAVSTEEVPEDTPHDASRSGPPGAAYRDTEESETITIREVIATFSDEPDWGMDQNLFLDDTYGYGSVPFGPVTGVSSQACFHMAFFHENPLVMRVLARLRTSFMEERIRVFLALARLSLDLGVEYWGWRFASWAAHYLQDLTQPYHARALPFPLCPILMRFLRTPSPREFAESNTNILANRHHFFEAAVHLIINEVAKKRTDHPFMRALGGTEHSFRGSLRAVMEQCSKVPARLAPRINRMTELLADEPRMNDNDYSIGDDPHFPLQEKLAAASADRPRLFHEFLEATSRCLSQAGQLTRWVMRSLETGKTEMARTDIPRFGSRVGSPDDGARLSHG